MKKSKCAFTLIETLVVVAIIGIMIAMIIPGTTRVRTSALRTKDASNLRQIGVAAQLYVQDNNGQMVPAFDPGKRSRGEYTVVWQFSLLKYMEGFNVQNLHDFMTAVSQPDSIFNAPGTGRNTGSRRTYALNTQTTNARWENRITRVPNPANIIHIGPIEPRNTEWMATSDGTPNWGAPMAFRYGNLTNFLFVDGHVGLRSAEQVRLNPTGHPSHFRWW